MFENILNKFIDVRNFTEKLCENLTAEDRVCQTIFDVSPPNWHLAHTTWYFEMFFLKEYVKDYKLFNQNFPYLFNSYYNSLGSRIDKNSRGSLSRPSTEEILDYRHYVEKAITNLANDGELQKIFDREGKKAILIFNLGINHEEQHQELLLYDIKHILGTNILFPKYIDPKIKDYSAPSELDFYEIEEGIYETGFRGSENDFFFDNEQPRHKSYIYPFGIANRLISNGEYLNFIEDGGYDNPLLWLSDGWDFIKESKITRPLYWYKKEDIGAVKHDVHTAGDFNWLEYMLGGIEELNTNMPVCNISFYEADAYARWAGARLPRENEWEVAAYKYQPMENKLSIDKKLFLESEDFRATYNEKDISPFAGSLWEWTGSYYLPYPGYKQDKGALGEYNGKFMANQIVLKGGSFATPISHYRHSYRNFFHPTKRWQFSGIRLAKDL